MKERKHLNSRFLAAFHLQSTPWFHFLCFSKFSNELNLKPFYQWKYWVNSNHGSFNLFCQSEFSKPMSWVGSDLFGSPHLSLWAHSESGDLYKYLSCISSTLMQARTTPDKNSANRDLFQWWFFPLRITTLQGPQKCITTAGFKVILQHLFHMFCFKLSTNFSSPFVAQFLGCNSRKGHNNHGESLCVPCTAGFHFDGFVLQVYRQWGSH